MNSMFNPDDIKADFPILTRQVHGQPLIYLDNAATSQKPRQVIQAIVDYYEQHNANVHRGVHQLSDESTTLFENAHQRIAEFLGATKEELILVRNTTEAINGVAYAWADRNLKAGDVIVTTLMEHHANLVTWQEVCKRTGAELEFIDLTPDGQLNLEEFHARQANFADRVKLVACSHVSNTLGTVNPIEELQRLFPQARMLIDGAQAVPHVPVNFHQLDVDFYVFSGHKMLGPMGIGGLLVKKELLVSGEFSPWLFGGGMISEVYADHTTFSEDLCERYVAGTPDVASTVGLAAACDYLSNIGMSHVQQHDQELVTYTLSQLSQVPEVTLVGPHTNRVGSVAFTYHGVHAHDVAQILDSQGIAVRSGHHCTMPLHQHFKWQATIRASFQVYNSKHEIDQLVTALAKVQQVFA